MGKITSNKIIAKNTIMLYFRMMITMAVSLFTSRVILQALGVDDYGLYQAVGGIVGFLGFINGALATGSSRFLTFALGEGDDDKLTRTFSTTLSIHILLALLVILIGETLGLWFLYNKLVISEDRMIAAVYCYHLSIITAAVSITQVPYSATIISHERMSIYTYTSIVDVVLKLIIVYLLYIGNFDKLMLYATLHLLVNVGMQLFYRWYCINHFHECKYRFILDKALFNQIGKFSGWSLIANCSIALNSQGILILLNIFFAPAVVAARAISLQVNAIINQFVNNFRMAANPQITKRYAAGDLEGSKTLLLESTRYSYYLFLLIGLPVLFSAQELLHLWLGIVPEYAVIFLQLIIIQNLFQVFDTSLYQALYAKGRLRENALISPTIGLIRFPVIYILFKYGCSPVALSWASIATYMITGLFIKPFLLVRICGYYWKDFKPLYSRCLLVTAVAFPIPLLFYFYYMTHITSEILRFFSMASIGVIITGLSIWYVGLNKQIRDKMMSIVISKLKDKL